MTDEKTAETTQTQAGFTLIEILVALVVLIIGVAGILTMQMSAMKGTAYSRHASEAITLAEDKIEQLMSVDPTQAGFAGGNDIVNSQGDAVAGTEVAYTRTWTINGSPLATVSVTISWNERGTENHSLVFQTQRMLF